jgi:hypothetical protein
MASINNNKCICGTMGSLKCSKCDEQYYCSAQCQRDNWKTHKGVCRTPYDKHYDFIKNFDNENFRATDGYFYVICLPDTAYKNLFADCRKSGHSFTIDKYGKKCLVLFDGRFMYEMDDEGHRRNLQPMSLMKGDEENDTVEFLSATGLLMFFFEKLFKEGVFSEEAYSNLSRMVLTCDDRKRDIAEKFFRLWAGREGIDPCITLQAILLDDGVADIIEKHNALVWKFTTENNNEKIEKLWKKLSCILIEILFEDDEEVNA